MTMSFNVVIPARHASMRLPGKPLLPIAGKAMIEHVYRRACESGAQHVLIATDDDAIEAACQGFGAQVQMTATSHASGTDRIAEVAAALRWDEEQIVVNVQCDEPLIPPAIIRQAAELLRLAPEAKIATLAEPIRSLDEYLDPNVVKVALAESGLALYFSRAPIPWNRDGATAGLLSQADCSNALRHIGIYAYRVGSLLKLSASSPSPLESAERLEQLRALWLGMSIKVAIAVESPGLGVDTEKDLEAVAAMIENAERSAAK